MTLTPPFREFDPVRAASQVLRNFQMGAICPADMWLQMADVLGRGDVEQILNALPPDSQAALRESYQERPISFRVLRGNPLRRQIKLWLRTPRSR